MTLWAGYVPVIDITVNSGLFFIIQKIKVSRHKQQSKLSPDATILPNITSVLYSQEKKMKFEKKEKISQYTNKLKHLEAFCSESF